MFIRQEIDRERHVGNHRSRADAELIELGIVLGVI
jgi:hypothetical protein